MIDRKNKFIIFLTLCLSLLALIVKSAPFRMFSAATVLGQKETGWLVTQDDALKIAERQKQVKQLLRRGEVRQETEAGITIAQPELNLSSPPTTQSPYWQFDLIERTIVIPKSGQPTETTTSILTISIDAFSGKSF